MALPVARKVGTSSTYGNVVARSNFTPEQQRIMDAGGNANGYAVVDGFFTYVGVGVTGEAARARVFGTTAPATPAGTGTYNPDQQPKGAWMAPGTMFDGRTTLPDGSSGAGNLSGAANPQAAKDDADKLARDKDALARIKNVLGNYGLEDLADWAWQQILGGKGEAEIMQDLRDHPVFKREFPEIEERTKRKLAPLSPGEIVSYRKNARQMMRAAGLPDGFYDSKDDFTKLLVSDVSLSELNERVEKAREATFAIPSAVRTRLEQRFGVTPGSGLLTSFFLDPDRALPLIQRDVNAAKIGGRADMAGYAGLSNDKAAELADAGVSEGDAVQGFGELSRQRELFTSLDRGEDTIDQDTQLGAAFANNGNAQRRIQERQRRRQARFSDGGGFASGQRGVSGLQAPERA